MKRFLSFLFALIMMIACSVGYGKDSPPKNTSFDHYAIGSVSNDAAIVARQMNVIAHFECVNTHISAYVNAKVEVPAVTSKVICLPEPSVGQLNRYIHYNLITNHFVTSIEKRCRSSDFVKANKSKDLSFTGNERC